MKRFLLAVAIVLLAASSAFGGWGYVAGPAVVYHYWPVGPVYAYPAPVVVAPAVVAPVPAVVSGPVLYPAPVVIRSKVYIPGRPVRNAVRAVLP
jgi:hypothetical protein